MSSQLVIKVKYQDVLRRFSVLCNVDGFLDLDMNGLRTKIINLFKLAPDADFNLTYIDEDNDVVTLADDDDLLDVVKQGLNPLRINVVINSERDGRFDIRTSGTSTPMSSPLSPSHPLSQLNFGVEILKSVPEPLLSTLMKLSCDLTSKAASSAPAFLPEPCNALMKHTQKLVSKAASPGLIPNELSECLMKLGLLPQCPSECQDGMMSSAKDNDSHSSMNQGGRGVPTEDQATSSELKAPTDNPPVGGKVNVVSDSPNASTGPAASLKLKAITDSASDFGNGKMIIGSPKASKQSEAPIVNSTAYDCGGMFSSVPKASKDSAAAFSKLKAPIDKFTHFGSGNNTSGIVEASKDPEASFSKLKAPLNSSTLNDDGNKTSGVAGASKEPAAASLKLKAPADNPTLDDNDNMTRGFPTSVFPAPLNSSTLNDDGNKTSGVAGASKEPAAASLKLKAPADNPTLDDNDNMTRGFPTSVFPAPLNSSTLNDDGNKTSGIDEASKEPAAASLKLKAPADNPTLDDNDNMTRGFPTSVFPANFTLPSNSIGSELSTGVGPFPFFMSSNDKSKKLLQESDWFFTESGHVPASSIPGSLVDSLVGLHMQPPGELKEALVSPVHKHGRSAVRSGRKKKSSSEIDNSLGLTDAFSRNNRSVSPTYYVGATMPLSSSRSHNARTNKRGNSHSNSEGRTFHRGVRCDGCGAYPITGPRYKSLVKEDYDLCSICFNEMGGVNEYVRVDHPISWRDARLFHDSFRHNHLRRISSSRRWPGVEAGSHEPRLNSCFINDVNVLDGTSMAPKTSFTKIWRMQNNGSMPWPKGTQLVWIGGDRLTDRESIELEIPFDGCPVGKELDVAVDCTAPELPGQYISYWRLAIPTGNKFGQCVWVLIQVEGPSHDPWFPVDESHLGIFSESLNGWNLNPLREGNGTKEPIIDMNVEPVDDMPDEFILKMDTELVNPKDCNSVVGNDQEQGPNGGEPVSSTPDNHQAVSYPLIDLSTSLPDPSSLIDAPDSSDNESVSSNIEQYLLKELDEMGFKQIDLNKEVLRMNKYNLEHSLDDLCGFSEWSPLLAELQEMGFRDRELNRKLLIKNGGSIKRVVMDLIAGEKA